RLLGGLDHRFDRGVPAPEEIEEALFSPLGRVALAFGDGLGRVPVGPALAHAPLAEPAPPAPRLTPDQAIEVERNHGPPGGISTITWLRLVEEGRSDHRMQPIGTNQEIPHCLAAVGKARGDLPTVLLDADTPRSQRDLLGSRGPKQDVKQLGPVEQQYRI